MAEIAIAAPGGAVRYVVVCDFAPDAPDNCNWYPQREIREGFDAWNKPVYSVDIDWSFPEWYTDLTSKRTAIAACYRLAVEEAA